MAFIKSTDADGQIRWEDKERGYKACLVKNGAMRVGSHEFIDTIWLDVFQPNSQDFVTRIIIDIEDEEWNSLLVEAIERIELFFSKEENISKRGIFFMLSPYQVMAQYEGKDGIWVYIYDMLFERAISECFGPLKMYETEPGQALRLSVLKEIAAVTRELLAELVKIKSQSNIREVHDISQEYSN